MYRGKITSSRIASLCILAFMIQRSFISSEIYPRCPQMCVCYYDIDGLYMDCSNAQLRAIPDQIYGNVTFLKLNNNYITHLEPLKSWNLKYLKTLLLSHNQISSIDVLQILDMPMLQMIDISYNMLTKFELAIFENNHHMFSIMVESNLIDEVILNRGPRDLMLLFMENNTIQNIQIAENFQQLVPQLVEVKLYDNPIDCCQVLPQVTATNITSLQGECDAPLELAGLQFWEIADLDFGHISRFMCIEYEAVNQAFECKVTTWLLYLPIVAILY